MRSKTNLVNAKHILELMMQILLTGIGFVATNDHAGVLISGSIH